MIRSKLVLCLLLGSTSTALGQQVTGKNRAADRALPEIKIDRDNIVVNESVRIKPGRYVIADNDGNGVLQIAADNVVVDFNKATLESRRNAKDGAKDGFDGMGVAMSGRKNVTVKNANVYGYRFNLRATDSRELKIENCDLSHSRAQRISRNGQPIDIFLDIRHPDEWREYGAAIWLENCRKSTVQGCQAHGAQNGLCLVATNGTTVHDNDFGFNSGWGIALSGSKNNVVSWNHCDFVNRPCQNGGGDNAGLAVVNGSERNYIVGNSLLFGGDGFFLTDGENGGVRPSNHNVVALNDGSWADAIAFEGTFATGNIYYKNVASDCNYGFWLGWASGTLIVDNVIERNRISGIDIGCGQGHRIEGNQIKVSGQSAIHLYNDEDDPTVVAKTFSLVNNTIETAPLGLQIEKIEELFLEKNRFRNAPLPPGPLPTMRQAQGMSLEQFEKSPQFARIKEIQATKPKGFLTFRQQVRSQGRNLIQFADFAPQDFRKRTRETNP